MGNAKNPYFFGFSKPNVHSDIGARNVMRVIKRHLHFWLKGKTESV
jgi:hypothetical protein